MGKPSAFAVGLVGGVQFAFVGLLSGLVWWMLTDRTFAEGFAAAWIIQGCVTSAIEVTDRERSEWS